MKCEEISDLVQEKEKIKLELKDLTEEGPRKKGVERTIEGEDQAGAEGPDRGGAEEEGCGEDDRAGEGPHRAAAGRPPTQRGPPLQPRQHDLGPDRGRAPGPAE